MANVGKNIKQLRIKKNFTQDQLAEQLFVTRQTVSNYENNKSNPDIDMLIKIAEVLDTDVNALIYGTQETISREKQIVREIILGVIVLLLGFTVAKGNEFFTLFKNTYYEIYPLVDFTLLIKIPYTFLVGWYCMELFLFFFKVQPIRPGIIKWVRRITVLILIIYFMASLPYLIWQGQYWLTYAVHGHNYANAYYGTFEYGIFWRFESALFLAALYAGWYLLALIPGILWRLSSPVHQKQPKEQEK